MELLRRLKVIENWRDVLKLAWSVRLAILAAILSGLEVLLSFTDLGLPPGIFAAVSALVTLAAVFARIIAQEKI